MLINGQPAKSNLPNILKQLADLPSSFPNYNSRNINSAKLKAAYMDQKALADKSAEKGEHKKAIGFYEDAISGALNNKDYPAAELIYIANASSHQKAGTLNKYKQEQLTNLKRSSANRNQEAELPARLALGGIYKINGDNEKSIEHYSKSYSLMQGKVDYEAYRVEQGEVAFSGKEKLGTDNILQCVAVILHDPISKKTALAHVDIYTNVESLNPVIAKFGKNAQLNAYLVGGGDQTYKKDTSNDNIQKVVKALNSKANINILSADIGDKVAPSGIVFDPITAELTHAVPGRDDKTTFLRKSILTPESRNLRNAFDLTESTRITQPILTHDEKLNLVKKCLYVTSSDSLESRNANIVYEPFSKAANEIARKNPEVVEDFFKKLIAYRIDEHYDSYGEKNLEKLKGYWKKKSAALISGLKNNNISIWDAKTKLEETIRNEITVTKSKNLMSMVEEMESEENIRSESSASRSFFTTVGENITKFFISIGHNIAKFFTAIGENVTKFFTSNNENTRTQKNVETSVDQIIENNSNISTHKNIDKAIENNIALINDINEMKNSIDLENSNNGGDVSNINVKTNKNKTIER